MGASFLITLREGLEIALVIAIVLAYLAKTGRRELFTPVAIGGAVAGLVCVIAGIVFHLAVGKFDGKPEQAIEGTLALTAAAVLTWMIFWMRKNARGMSAELHGKIDAAASRSAMSVGLVAFAAVAREGFETVLFLLSAESGSASGAAVVIGGLLGLVVAAVLGVAVYRNGSRLDLRKFFLITGALLILFAAGLVGKAVHEFGELFEFGGWMIEPLWLIESGPLATGWVFDFLKGMFGWSADPERIRVIAYVAYLIPIGYAFFAGARPPADRNQALQSGEQSGEQSLLVDNSAP